MEQLQGLTPCSLKLAVEGLPRRALQGLAKKHRLKVIARFCLALAVSRALCFRAFRAQETAAETRHAHAARRKRDGSSAPSHRRHRHPRRRPPSSPASAPPLQANQKSEALAHQLWQRFLAEAGEAGGSGSDTEEPAQGTLLTAPSSLPDSATLNPLFCESQGEAVQQEAAAGRAGGPAASGAGQQSGGSGGAGTAAPAGRRVKLVKRERPTAAAGAAVGGGQRLAGKRKASVEAPLDSAPPVPKRQARSSGMGTGAGARGWDAGGYPLLVCSVCSPPMPAPGLRSSALLLPGLQVQRMRTSPRLAAPPPHQPSPRLPLARRGAQPTARRLAPSRAPSRRSPLSSPPSLLQQVRRR